MSWQSPKDAMPWVGLYASGASLLCTIAMAADAFQGFRQRRLWFPCRFFTINAVSITLIAIAMKLPVDLTTEMPSCFDVQAKYFSIYFLFIMLANFLPSLGLLGDKDLLTNIIAFGILIVTISVNVLIQSFTGSVYDLEIGVLFFIVSIMFPLSVALIVPTCRRILERQYKELHESDLTLQEVSFSYKGLIHNIKKYWIMAETGNCQFVIACSSVSYALGVLCLIIAVISFLHLYPKFNYLYGHSYSDYKWSISIIVKVQLFGIAIGCIAPSFRCFTAISHFNISRKWSMNHLNVFRVEKYWTQKLKRWKRTHIRSNILGRHLKIVFNGFKNMILKLFIVLQITLVVICKTICLVPRCFLILLSFCFHYLGISLLKICKEEQNASNNSVRSEIEQYSGYVIHFEKESQLSKRVLKNALNSITKLIQKSETQEPSNLVNFLQKSTGFNGVLEFNNDKVPPLHAEDIQNCWSLVLVTLTAVAIALPNIEHNDVQMLLASMREGLQFVSHVEESLDANMKDLVKARKASRHVWTEVEVHNKWLQIDLQENARNGKTSKVTLQWLGEKAVKVVARFTSSKKESHMEHKFIAASAMYKISQTILHHCNELEKWPEDKELFVWISTLNADISCACFTNLPRVIIMKCHHDAIEKREEGILCAAQLLGKSKQILKILKPCQLPNIDPDSMAYIDKWRAVRKSQILGVGVSLAGTHKCSSSSNESHSITIM